jgi:dTDP-4-dehydrorhamnose reductase
MNILVTGADGQVAREVVSAARAQQHTVLACNKHDLDITSAPAIHDFFSQYAFDIIVNCAAYTAVDKAEDEPEKAYAVNATGVGLLACAAAEKNIPLLHLSTDYIFDGEKKAAYTETDPAAPQNQYGYSKWHGELALQQTWHKHIILRVSWIFGRHGHNFVKTIVKLANTRDQLSVVHDQLGCPSSAADIARVILQLLPDMLSDNPAFGVYHYCNAPQSNWHAFAEAIVAEGHALGLVKPCVIEKIQSSAYPVKAKRPQNSCLDITKIQHHFNIVPSHWRDELKLVLLDLKQP